MDFRRHTYYAFDRRNKLVNVETEDTHYPEGVIEVIDDKLKRQESIHADTQQFVRKWLEDSCDLHRKANSYAKSTIASTVADGVYRKIMNKETAFEAWGSLKQQFEATSKDELFKISTEFLAFGKVPREDVSTHIAKPGNLGNELNNGLETREES